MAVAELAEGLAHDLKNQLSVVAMSVQLARARGGAGRDDLLDRALMAAMRAAGLMDEMLGYTRGRPGPGVASDICEALETAVAGAWGYCEDRGVRLEMQLQPEVPAVAGAPSALRVLLLHTLKWAADLAGAPTHLVAAIETIGERVAIRLQPVPRPRRPDPGVRPTRDTETALVEALATEAGATLTWDVGGPVLWLRALPPQFAVGGDQAAE